MVWVAEFLQADRISLGEGRGASLEQTVVHPMQDGIYPGCFEIIVVCEIAGCVKEFRWSAVFDSPKIEIMFHGVDSSCPNIWIFREVELGIE